LPPYLVVIAGKVRANQSRNKSREIVTLDESGEMSSSIAKLQSGGCIERHGVGKGIEFLPCDLYLTAENVRANGADPFELLKEPTLFTPGFFSKTTQIAFVLV
jgi:hypothetical protein